MEFSTAVCGSHYYKKYWDLVENKCLHCAPEKENTYDYFAIKMCQKDCGSFSFGNPLTDHISTWPRSESLCYVDINVVLRILACSRRTGDSLFDKGLHASHGEKQTNHLDVGRNDWRVIPRERRSTCNRKYYELQWNYRASRHRMKRNKKNT